VNFIRPRKKKEKWKTFAEKDFLHKNEKRIFKLPNKNFTENNDQR
jgi:hypothetical protein